MPQRNILRELWLRLEAKIADNSFQFPDTSKKSKKGKRNKLTSDIRHLTSGVRMVDVSGKEVTAREAVAQGKVKMKPETLRLVKEGKTPKGDVLAAAELAGIQAAKKTSELIPLCHPLAITWAEVKLDFLDQESAVRITATVRTKERTGVEMEALTATAVAALTLYDMLKPVDKEITITDICLVKKVGGRSGTYIRK